MMLTQYKLKLQGMPMMTMLSGTKQRSLAGNPVCSMIYQLTNMKLTAKYHGQGYSATDGLNMELNANNLITIIEECNERISKID